MSHLSPSQLVDELSTEQQGHLDGCVRCRVDRRLLHGSSQTLAPAMSAQLSAQRSDYFSSVGDSVSADGPAPPTAALPDLDPGRFDILERIGMGGMAHVERVRDLHLGRTVAMKVARESLQNNPGARSRFVAEARICAQLQHPGIVPVHELGVLDDGRPAFLMKEVRGQTLRDVLGVWPLRRMLEAFRRICETVAYAHSRGVSHRDLKPDNIMLGEWGEVVVLDWGLAKVGEASDPELTVDTVGAPLETRTGSIAGTPSYMSPEQAMGRTAKVGPSSDVFSLGGILHSILTGEPPYTASTGAEVVALVILGPPPPPTGPEPLVELCLKAMARELDQRTLTALQLAAAVQDWLDDAHRRERALAVLEKAMAELPLASEAERRARNLRAEAETLPKHQAWSAEDSATALEERASVHRVRFTHGVQGALTVDPELPEAHRVLAAHWRIRHQEAEAAREPTAALEYQLRLHDRGEHTSYLAGEGTVSFPLECEIFRNEVMNRRGMLVPVATVRPDRHRLPIGSYVLRAEGVAYPFAVGREAHVEVVPVSPGLGCVVPGGWFERAGSTVWVETFVMATDLVTHREYLEFLNAIDRGAALRHAPRERATRPGELGGLLVESDPVFRLREDAEGDNWNPRWPVWMITWHGARAYAAWRAKMDGVPWRLPWALEWEKAARGVDGRRYPWGDFIDSTWACLQGSHTGRPMPSVVGSHPVDTSPYGVRDLAGNVCEWTLDLFRSDGPPLADGVFQRPLEPEFGEAPQREVRGGSWCSPNAHAELTFREPRDATDRRWAIGFRLCYTPETQG